ncbi:hypothetical protein [Anaeromyxobacter oryzisoli]|uniref:hypothetical protein n=1 Tax=Anaeromyxobacter oryzisoli TaxID=2925408 RepID=UPI001F58A357|nr:hypothetical protein [Anaeromyxobacter sp. SG63]
MRLFAITAILVTSAAGCCYENTHHDACLDATGTCFTMSWTETFCLDVEDAPLTDLSVDYRSCAGTLYGDKTCADLGYREGP